MTQRFYFHDATNADSASGPDSTGLSSAAAVVTATGASTNRLMDGTLGAAQATASLSTSAVTTAQPDWFRRFMSPALAAGSFAGTEAVSFAGARLHSNSNSNFLCRCAVFIWRPPSTKLTVVDANGSLVIANPSATVTEAWANAVSSATAAAQTINEGDYLIVEIWRDNTVQSMATAYTNSFFYDGTAEGSNTSAASFVDVGRNLALSTGSSYLQDKQKRDYRQLLAQARKYLFLDGLWKPERKLWTPEPRPLVLA